MKANNDQDKEPTNSLQDKFKKSAIKSLLKYQGSKKVEKTILKNGTEGSGTRTNWYILGQNISTGKELDLSADFFTEENQIASIDNI